MLSTFFILQPRFFLLAFRIPSVHRFQLRLLIYHKLAQFLNLLAIIRSEAQPPTRSEKRIHLHRYGWF